MDQQQTTTANRSGSRILRAASACLISLAFTVCASGGAAAATSALPTLTISVLQFGTAHWELDHLKHRELDHRNGYDLVLKPVANLPASRLAVTSGSSDGAVADLLWAQARYEAGSPYLYVPFSSQIGDIVVAEGSTIDSVDDLAGKRIGVAGGPDSKGWILLQNVAAKQGVNLAVSADVQYAAPPLLSQALKRGRVDAIVTYWHFAARLKGSGGWRSAFGMADLLKAMDLDTNLPVLGYVFPAGWAGKHASLIERFSQSLNDTKTELAGHSEYWQRLRPLMGNPSDGVFEALRKGFLVGTPSLLTESRIGDLHHLLELTGTEEGSVMPEELFYRGGQ
ncbi:MAG: transporter substrate-binding domain-containing protein [Gammaproteobacteria bacterium]|nr:MAG: transporter substrate-binding domain-containing protein [Gammaproteobacteria bacterium]